MLSALYNSDWPKLPNAKAARRPLLNFFWGSAVDDDISVFSFPVILTAGRTALALISVVEQDNALPIQSKTITKCNSDTRNVRNVIAVTITAPWYLARIGLRQTVR